MKKSRLKKSSFFNSRQSSFIKLTLGQLTIHKLLLQLPYQPFKHIILCFIVLSLTACSSINKQPLPNTHIPPSLPNNSYFNTYVCQNPSSYRDNVIGNGTCVSLIKQCSPAPNTIHWSAGPKVLSLPFGSIAPGSIIATFKNGKYPNVTGYHAAIYIRHDKNGIWVWDQWVGKPVHRRLIRIRKDKATASNSAQEYRLVK